LTATPATAVAPTPSKLPVLLRPLLVLGLDLTAFVADGALMVATLGVAAIRVARRWLRLWSFGRALILI